MIKAIVFIFSINFAHLVYAKSCFNFLDQDPPAAHQIALSQIKFPEEGQFFIFERLLRLALYEAFDGQDFYTGLPLAYETMSIDHILPKSLGGPNNIANYVPTTGEINSKKGNTFTLRNLEDLKYVSEHFYPRVLAFLKLYGAFDNREEDLAKAQQASVKKTNYRYFKPFNEKADLEALVSLQPTVFRRRMDMPPIDIMEILFLFSQELSKLSESESTKIMTQRYFQFEIDYQDSPPALHTGDKTKYNIFLSHRRQSAKLVEDTLALTNPLFQITKYEFNPKSGKVEVGIIFHPNLAIKLLQAPSRKAAGLTYVFDLFKPTDITREEFIYWTE